MLHQRALQKDWTQRHFCRQYFKTIFTLLLIYAFGLFWKIVKTSREKMDYSLRCAALVIE